MPSLHFPFLLELRDPNKVFLQREIPRGTGFPKSPSRHEGMRNLAANTVCSALATVREKGRGNTTNLSRRRKQLRAQNLQRSLQTFQRQRERRHLPAAEVMIPLCSSLPSSPPLIPAPLTVHCFKNLSRRQKPPQSPHSVPRDRGAP